MDNVDPATRVLIFTAGASMTPVWAFRDPGGHAAEVVFPDGRREVLTGHSAVSSEVREALKAIIAGLEVVPAGLPVAVDCRVEKAVGPLRKGWLKGWSARGWKKVAGGPVANADLYRRIEELSAGRDIKWAWTKEHAAVLPESEVHRLSWAEEREGRKAQKEEAARERAEHDRDIEELTRAAGPGGLAPQALFDALVERRRERAGGAA